MINKRSLWFLTLFSLILVLSVYYITMPNDILLPEEQTIEPTVEVEESDILVALRAEADEELELEIANLQGILNKEDIPKEEKNNAIDKIKELNISRSEEETIEKQILEKYKLKAFVKVRGDEIKVVLSSSEHDASLANKIMRTVQENYKNKMYISIKFQS